MPGCSWARLKADAGWDIGGWGYADVEKQHRIDEDTVFNIASVSKQFTALAVMLLVRDGKLDLDAPLARYLPRLPGELGRPALRQVLRHTGGLPDYMDPLIEAGRLDEAVTVSETFDVLAQDPQLLFEPGSRFEYSNTGYFLLAQVVEAVSGKTLAAFSRQYVFEPLGMRDTHIVDHYPSGITQLARGYRANGGKVGISESSWEQTGDGQVHTSAGDMLRWLRHMAADTSLRTPSGERAPGVLSMLTDGQEPHPEDGDGSYYYGIEALRLGDAQTWGHGGGWAGYRSFLAYAPQTRQGVAIMCNITGLNLRAMAERMLSSPGASPQPIP
jgi:CubicO group peptidase (beta-lactamase class C family)